MTNPTVAVTAPRTVELQDRPVKPPGEGQVSIQSEITLVSTGTELTVVDPEPGLGLRWSGRGARYPYFPGYSNVGTVLDVGPGVDRALVGQRVQSYGGHAKYAVQPLNLVRPIRPDVPPEQAVFATMAEIAFNGVRRSEIGMGSAVVVYGLGLLGQISVRFARLCGARPVVAVDVGDFRLGLLPKCPAVVPVNPKKDSVKDKVKEATRGRMADVVLELTGAQGLIVDEIQLLRRQGTLGIVSGPKGKTEIDLHDFCVMPSIKIVGIFNGSHATVETPADPWTKSRDVELFMDLVGDGDLDVSGLITHRRPYTDAPAMYQMLVADRTQAMGVLFDWA